MTTESGHFENDTNAREFMSLLVQNQRNILAFILSLVPQKNDAEDIFQDTLTEMWKKFGQYESGTNFSAWGTVIAKYKILEYRRRTQKTKIHFGNQLLELLQAESSKKVGRLDEYIGALQDCTKRLSSKELDFLRLRYEEDMTFRNIARHTGLTHQAICKAMGRIHARLVRCIRTCLRLEELA